MASLADEIAKLSDPTPKCIDPEDDINVESTARVVDKFDEDPTFQPEFSILRRKTAPILEDIDARYAGKRISRKAFDETFSGNISQEIEDEESESDLDIEDEESEGGSEIEDEEGSETEDEESENDLEIEKKLAILQQKMRKHAEFLSKLAEESRVDKPSEEDDESDEKSGTDDDSSGEEVDEKSGTDDDSSGEEVENAEDMFQKFSHIDVNEEIEKGKSVEAQLGLWNKFCESRIRFQKVLTAANRLPQFHVWNNFKEESDNKYTNAVEEASSGLKSLLDIMLAVQSQLFLSNPETANIIAEAVTPPPSAHKGNSGISGDTKKRKLQWDEYDDVLSKRFKTFVPYRNSVIQMWDEKTRLATGRLMNKSFNAFNQSAVKQIDQILQDKQRLIRRTQLKRSVYHILGKNAENEDSSHLLEEKTENAENLKRDEHLNSYDPEIFDDDDFYRGLLRDVIESKSVGMDPDLLRSHMALQKCRSKLKKKKVDTKASKGRKIRFDVHPKMVSFMASMTSTFPDGTRDDLYKGIFAQNPTIALP